MTLSCRILFASPACLVTAILLAVASSSIAADVTKFRDRPDDWFATAESRQVLESVLSWQNDNGGWWKAYDATRPRPADQADPYKGRSIIDNGATWSELRLLARAYRHHNDERYKTAFDRGLALLLKMQYANGGWPQEDPAPADGYARFITFNDEAMVGVLRLLRDVAAGGPDFAFVDAATRDRCSAAFARGVDCILACQILVNREPTVWCAQHDEQTLAPAKARSYELPSFSGGESADIVMLLMEIEAPDDRVKRSVTAAVKWYEGAKLTGIRVERRPEPAAPDGFDLVVVNDPAAPPLWARFYDLETGKPFFCGRDGVKKATLAEIEIERRTGYAWLGTWGQAVLEKYPAWAKRHGVEPR